MTLTPALHVLLLVASASTTAVLAGYAWRRRGRRGVGPFGGLTGAFTLYSVAHLVGLLTPDPAWRLLWEYVQWTGTAAIPVFWVLFAMAYTGADEMLDRRTVGLLAVVPLVTVGLTWTNPWHGLMWADASVVSVAGLAIVEQPFGPWFLVFTMVAYGMLGVGAFLLLRLVWLSERLYADQALLLVVGVAAPVLANVMTVFGVVPIRTPTLDMTPYAFSVTGLAFGYALFRRRLFEVVPATSQLGRDAAIRDLEDAVFVVDTTPQVVYCNRAAADLFDCEPTEVLGEPVRSLLDGSDLDLDAAEAAAVAELERDDRVFEIRTSPVHDRRERLVGHTLVVQDVTARKRRARRLRRQRDELRRLGELDAVVRGVIRALVAATNRAEIERAVCDRLADSDLYRVACVADVPTWNGDAERWTVAGADGDATPVPSSLRDGSIVPDGVPASSVPISHSDDRGADWTVVPLVYGGTAYGALGLCSRGDQEADTGGHIDHERELLAELGELIGHAINAVENRQLLAAESVVELEFASDDVDGTLFQAASRAGCRLDMTGFVPDTGDGHLAYLRVEGASIENISEVLETISGGDVRPIRESAEGAGLLEWTVPEGTLLGTLARNGAHVLRATADENTARFVIEVASNTDVRAVVGRVQREFHDTWLDAKRERDRPVDQADTVTEDTIADLTDRQHQALETAYRAGYFDWPRESTAEEVAETLDIAAPTLHAHLRKAENKMFDDVFDRGPRLEE